MAFWGNAFIFNEIPCETFDLMLYDIDSEKQGEGTFASTVTVIEEVVGNRWRPYFYGTKFEKKLEFEIVFGVTQHRIDEQRYLDRYELEDVASWLTGHDRYMWLDIEQEDMEYVRYRCMISNLSIIAYGNIPWALKASVVCDSPYAYLYPQSYSYQVNGKMTINFLNESSHNGYYRPVVKICPDSGGDFSITNETDGGRTMALTNIPQSVKELVIDADHGVITNDQDINLYGNSNFVFLRLKRGYNTLTLEGKGAVYIQCEFPVNAGG